MDFSLCHHHRLSHRSGLHTWERTTGDACSFVLTTTQGNRRWSLGQKALPLFPFVLGGRQLLSRKVLHRSSAPLIPSSEFSFVPFPRKLVDDVRKPICLCHRHFIQAENVSQIQLLLCLYNNTAEEHANYLIFGLGYANISGIKSQIQDQKILVQ